MCILIPSPICLMLQSTWTHSFYSKTIYYAQLLTDVFCAWGSAFLGVRTSTRHTSLRCTWWLWMLCNGLPWTPCFNYPYTRGSLRVMRGCFRIPGTNYSVPGVSGHRGEWTQGWVVQGESDIVLSDILAVSWCRRCPCPKQKCEANTL